MSERLTGEDVLIVNGKIIPPPTEADYKLLDSSTLSHEANEEVRGLNEVNRKVWVSADSSHDISKAKSHGEVVTVVPGKVNVFGSDGLKNQVYDVLKNSSPDDYVILSGNMLAAAMTYECMMNLHGIVNVLIFSFRQEKYEVRSIRETRLDDETGGQ